MPFIPSTSVAKVAVSGTCNGTPWANVFHIFMSDPGNPTARDAVAAAIDDWAENDYTTAMGANCFYVQTTVTDVSVANGQQSVIIQSSPVAGTATGETLPSQNAGVVTKRTASTGRSFRGRFYTPGLTINTVDNGILEPSYITLALSVFDDLITDLVSAGSFLGVLSLYAGGFPREAGILSAVTALSMDDRVDTQRGRLD